MSNDELSDIESAVMAVLWKDRVHTSVFKSIAQCHSDIARIERMEAWAATLPDGEERRAYLRWLDYFKRDHHTEIENIERKERVAAVVPSINTFPE